MPMVFVLLLLLVAPAVGPAAELPIVDAHIHYNDDAWTVVPPKEAVALLRKAGVKRALVSSSNDEGTQKLLAEAPDFMVGTDTFVPERWHDVPEHASWSRAWLGDLPPDIAERIAWKNGEIVLGEALSNRR